MKKKSLLIGALTLFFGITAIAQEQTEFRPSGKATGKVFFNYHYDMTSGEEQESSFEVKRQLTSKKHN